LKEELTFTYLERMTALYPKRTAMNFLGKNYSYADLTKLSDKFATALADLGIGDNDKVILYMPNCMAWIIAYLGIQKIGAVPIAISPSYTSYEVDYVAKDSEAKAIVCDDVDFGYVKELSGTNIEKIIVVNVADTLPLWRRAAGFLLDRVPRGHVEWGENIYSFTKLLKKYPPTPPKIEINADHLAYLLYTGGTLGEPKGVAGTHRNLTVAAEEIVDIIKEYFEPTSTAFLLINPLFHILGQTVFIALSLVFGCKTVLMPHPNIDAILEATQRHKVNIFLGVPTLYRLILENDRLDSYDLSSFRLCWCGADVLPEETFHRWYRKTGVRIHQLYGATECISISVADLSREWEPTSMGHILPSRQYKVVDPDTLEEMPEGEAGEVLVYFEGMPKMYWKKPEETARSFVNLDGKIWYRTGDYVKRKGEELFFTDRRADVIKYKGYRVSASEIEAVLQDHPAVMEACVVGVTDPRVGERIKAVVVLKSDVRGVSASELMKWSRERLAAYKCPRYIEFRDMLPKSKVGKLLRREVREEARRRGHL